MATRTQVMLNCDLCGNAEDVQTWTFGLDGKAYEIDLCPKDGKGLSKVAAGYRSKARKITAGQSRRHDAPKPRPEAVAVGDRDRAGGKNVSRRGRAAGSQAEAGASGPGPQAAPSSRTKANAAGSRKGAKTSGPGRRAASSSRARANAAGSRKGAKASGLGRRATRAGGAQQDKGIYVYAILPADIEVADQMPGVGEHPGPLRAVSADGVAALISEVDLSGRLGSPGDRRTHTEIVDAIAAELPVLPLRFGTVLASEDQVTGELLAAHHDEFAAALEQLDGRAQFLVKGRYLEQPVLGEAASQNTQAAQLPDTMGGQDPDGARDARAELGEIINEVVTARRKQDTRALEQAVAGICVASVVREPVHELDAMHVAFLVDADREGELEQAIEDLAGDWGGRIEIELLGPMAAYDFVTTAAADR